MTGGEIRRGTLERVPQTPQNFSRLFYCFPETALVFVSGLFTPPHSAGDKPPQGRVVRYPVPVPACVQQKRQEEVLYEQCRQPRRGGTGGDGTIRRKRRRRLRWSSPPGQGEQVPLGFSPAGRLQRRSNPPRHGGTPGAGKRQMPPKFCRNRLTSTAPIWYNTNNPAGCLPPEKEHGMP